MRIWRWLSLLLLILGISYMLGMGYFIGRVSGHSLWYLEKFFNGHSPNAENSDALYRYAEDLTIARNGYAMKFHLTVGAFICLAGAGGFLITRRRLS